MLAWKIRVHHFTASAGLTTSDDGYRTPSRSSSTTSRARVTPLLVLSFNRSRYRRIDMNKATENPIQSDSKAAEIIEDISEKLHLPRRRDLSFYLVLILAVLPLWSIVPLSWAFVIYSLRSGAIWWYSWKSQALFAVALVEVRL